MDPDAIDGILDASRGDDGSETCTTALRLPRGTDDRIQYDFRSCTNPSVPEGAVRVYQSAFSTARRFPEDTYCEYRVAAGSFVGCKPEQVIPTPGRVAGIRLVLAAGVDSGDEVLVGTPAPPAYEREITLQGGTPTFVDAPALFEADPAAYDAVLAATPNRVSGEAYDARALSALADRCRAAETPLVLDESFRPLTDLPSMAGREGVAVVHSLGRLFGFPGLRAGFVAATGECRDRLDVARLPASLGTAAAELGTYCMDQQSFLEETRQRTESERERLRDSLAGSFDVSASVGPCLLLDAGAADRAQRVIDRCRDADVAVYDARKVRGLDSHIRVAVKLPADNDVLIETLS